MTASKDNVGAADHASLLTALGVDVRPELLRLALTHRSYAYENGGLPTNERLEFLGDSVLGLSITERLYTEHPEKSEGELAKLRASVVNMHALAEVARGLGDGGLGQYLLLGKGEELTAERGLGVPAYEITSTGPDHNKEFTATTVIAGHAYGSGIGRSKKEAEQKAAGTAYKALTDESTTEA